MEDENLKHIEYENGDGKFIKRIYPNGRVKDILHVTPSQSYIDRVKKPAQEVCKKVHEEFQIDLLAVTHQKMKRLQTVLDTYELANKHKQSIKKEIDKCKKQINEIKKKLK